MSVTPAQILACPMRPNDADAATVRDYLVGLSLAVWQEGEGFSGKRPFGNSSWEYEVFTSLAHAKLIPATFDEWGNIEDFDRPAADALVADAIRSLTSGHPASEVGQTAVERIGDARDTYARLSAEHWEVWNVEPALKFRGFAEGLSMALTILKGDQE